MITKNGYTVEEIDGSITFGLPNGMTGLSPFVSGPGYYVDHEGETVAEPTIVTDVRQFFYNKKSFTSVKDVADYLENWKDDGFLTWYHIVDYPYNSVFSVHVNSPKYKNDTNLSYVINVEPQPTNRSNMLHYSKLGGFSIVDRYWGTNYRFKHLKDFSPDLSLI